MNYVKNLNIFGVEAKEIPSIVLEGAPTTTTVGAVGCIYMNSLTGDLYKCVSINSGSYIWTRLISEENLPYVTPEMYGAKGDGKTDDAVALQTAFDSGNTVYLSKKTYLTYSPLNITKEGTTIRGEGTIDCRITDGVAITIAAYKVNIEMEQLRSSKIGLLLDGNAAHISECNINIKYIDASTIGLCLRTNANSVIYNKFVIQRINARDIGVLVWVDDKFINENEYYIEHIFNCNVGVYLHGDHSLNAKGGNGTNDNKFFNTSFEGIKSSLSDTSEYTSGLSGTCSIYLDNTHGNVFRTCRMQEQYGQKRIIFNSSCNRNNIEISDLNTTEIDITGLTSEDSLNIIEAFRYIYATGGYACGNTAIVSGKLGIVYNPIYGDNILKNLTTDIFPNQIIGMVGGLIPTYLSARNSAINGLTFTLHGLFSDARSIARGCPIVVYFGGDTESLIKIVDSLGDTIIDNSNGSYQWKTVSIRWIGYSNGHNKNLWEVTPFTFA